MSGTHSGDRNALRGQRTRARHVDKTIVALKQRAARNEVNNGETRPKG